MNNAGKPPVSFQVERLHKYDEDDAQRKQQLRDPGDLSRARVVAEAEPAAPRVIVSIVVAAVLGLLVTALGRQFGESPWFALVAGPVSGFTLLIPVRARMAEWRSGWASRVLPGCAVFALLVLNGSDFGAPAAAARLPQGGLLVVLAAAVALVAGLTSGTQPVEAQQARRLPPPRPVLDLPWSFTDWSPAQWDEWWRQFHAWNRFREEELRQVVPRLDRPPSWDGVVPGYPPPPQVIAAWQQWYADFAVWRSSAVAQPAARGPAIHWERSPTDVFPPGWGVLRLTASERCPICHRPAGVLESLKVPVAKCPGICAKPVCRDCLHSSRDRCPICGHH